MPFEGLNLLRQGKVRDTYELPGHPHLLLVLASDRISIFDFVLNALVPDKGAVLTAFNIFWRMAVLKGFDHDLFAVGEPIDQFLPDHLTKNSDLQKAAIVVQKLEMAPVEAIIRGYLTGSGWQAYQKTDPHMVCGHTLPSGLKDASRLPKSIFTPTTKEEVGHDVHMDVASVRQEYSWMEQVSLSLYEKAADYALKKDIIIADTKFEFSKKGMVGDEVLTPDSSRFWDKAEWEKAHSTGKSPQSRDKQFVREWGKTVGIDKRDPASDEDVAYVHSLKVPEEVIEKTSQIYRDIFKTLTGKTLDEFQKETMGIE